MPLFYFIIQTGDRTILDPDGSDLPDLEAARAEAEAVARELLVSAIRTKKIEAPDRLLVADQNERTLIEISLRDVLPINLRR